MRSTFNLKEPKKEKETLILFSSYFKNEGRKFVYSTGESITPKEWDFENRQPNNTTGRSTEADRHKTIKRQLDRYSNFFSDTISNYKLADKEILISSIKADFDTEFKRTTAISNKFIHVYDLFIAEKENDFTDEANAKSTIKRYEYNKTILEDFQTFRKKKIHFNQINESFYKSLLTYCITEKKHSANTLRRNMGMLKTYLYWAVDNGHTYKTDFQKFKMPKPQPTDEVALTLIQVQEVFEHDFSNNPKLERVRDLFVFGCSTGMRISNYSKIQKKDIQNGIIKVRDYKNNDKTLEIPLNDFSIYVLEKYEYNLPKISNQKFNIYIKEVFKAVGFDQNIKKTIKIGKELIEKITPFYERVSSHTARRSFITIMKNKKIPDKVIMGMTGHKSLDVFNKYYKPNDEEKKDFMQVVWTMEKTPLRKIN